MEICGWCYVFILGTPGIWKLREEVERLRDSVMREMQLGFRDKLNYIIHTGTRYPRYHGDDSCMHSQRHFLKKNVWGIDWQWPPLIVSPHRIQHDFTIIPATSQYFLKSYLTLIPRFIASHTHTLYLISSHMISPGVVSHHSISPLTFLPQVVSPHTPSPHVIWLHIISPHMASSNTTSTHSMHYFTAQYLVPD